MDIAKGLGKFHDMFNAVLLTGRSMLKALPTAFAVGISVILSCLLWLTTSCSKQDTPSASDSTHPPKTAPSAAVHLMLRWPVGKQFHYRYEVRQKGEGSGNPMADQFNNTGAQTLRYTLGVLEETEDHGRRLAYELKALRVEMSMLHISFRFDSESESQEPMEPPLSSIAEGMKALIGSQLELRLNAQGQLIEVLGLDALREGLTQSVPPEAMPMVEGFLQEDIYRQMVELAFIPDHPIVPGDTWTQSYLRSLGSSGAVPVKNTFEFSALEPLQGKAVHTVRYAGSIEPDDSQSADMMGAEMTLISGTNSGVYHLDQEWGVVVSATSQIETQMLLELPPLLKTAIPDPITLTIHLDESTESLEVSDLPPKEN